MHATWNQIQILSVQVYYGKNRLSPKKQSISSEKTHKLYTRNVFLDINLCCVCLFCRYMTNSPQVPFQEPKGWPFSARCVAWTNSTRGPVANKAVLGIAPGLWTWDDLTHTLAKGLRKYRIYTKKINPSFFSACLIFGAHFALRILKNESSLYANALLPKKSHHVKSQQASTGSKMSPG